MMTTRLPPMTTSRARTVEFCGCASRLTSLYRFWMGVTLFHLGPGPSVRPEIGGCAHQWRDDTAGNPFIRCGR